MELLKPGRHTRPLYGGQHRDRHDVLRHRTPLRTIHPRHPSGGYPPTNQDYTGNSDLLPRFPRQEAEEGFHSYYVLYEHFQALKSPFRGMSRFEEVRAGD